MKLWRVENGYTGNGSVRVLVIAATEERALALARESFKREADKRANNPTASYPDDYWQELQAWALSHDTAVEWASEADDD